MNLAAYVRALRAPKDPNPIPRKFRFLRRGSLPTRGYDRTTRPGRRARAFADAYAYTAKTFEMPRATRRSIARDIAKGKTV